MATTATSATSPQNGVALSAQKTVLDAEDLRKQIAIFVPNTRDPTIFKAWAPAYSCTRTHINADALTRTIAAKGLSGVRPWFNEHPHVTHVDLRKLLVNHQGNETVFLEKLVKSVIGALNVKKLQGLVLPHDAVKEDALALIKTASESPQLRALDFSPLTHPLFDFPALIESCPQIDSLVRVSFYLKEGDNQVELFASIHKKFPNLRELAVTAETTQPPLRAHELFKQFPQTQRLELEHFNFNEKTENRRPRVTNEQWKQLPKLAALEVLVIKDCVFTQYILNCFLAAAPPTVRWSATGNLQGRVCLGGGKERSESPKKPILPLVANRTPSPLMARSEKSPLHSLVLRTLRQSDFDFKRSSSRTLSFDGKEDKEDGKTDFKGGRQGPAVKLRYHASFDHKSDNYRV